MKNLKKFNKTTKNSTMIESGIKEIDECLNKLEKSNILLFLYTVDNEDCYITDSIFYRTIIDACKKGLEIVFFAENEFIKLWLKEKVGNAKNLHVEEIAINKEEMRIDKLAFRKYRKWTINLVKERLSKYDNYDLVVINDFENMETLDGNKNEELLLNELSILSNKIDSPLIIGIDYYTFEDSPSEDENYKIEQLTKFINISVKYVDFIISCIVNHNLFKTTTLEHQVKKTESFQIYDEKSGSYIELNQDDVSFINNIKALGISEEDIFELTFNYLKSKN